MNFFVALLFFSLFRTDSSIMNCSTDSSIFQITRLELYPENPVGGDSVSLLLNFVNTEIEVSSGSIYTFVSIQSQPLQPLERELCSTVECPIPLGWNDRSATSVWPLGVIDKASVRFVWKNEYQEELLCMYIPSVEESRHSRYSRHSMRGSLGREFASMVWTPISAAPEKKSLDDAIVWSMRNDIDSTVFYEDSFSIL